MIKDTIESIRRLIGSRAYAYKVTFNKESAWAHIVLRDLAQFCRAHKTTFHEDPRMQAVLEGRREVFLRIQEHLQLTETQIFDLHHIRYVPPKGDS